MSSLKSKKEHRHRHHHSTRYHSSSTSSSSHSSSKISSSHKEKDKTSHHINPLSLSISNYSNECNPFGDPNLHDIFIWKKKYKKMGLKAKPHELSQAISSTMKKRKHELLSEIVKVKHRQEKRKEEKKVYEQMKLEKEREINHKIYQELEKKEDDFIWKNSQLRSLIRIKEGRENPFDILIKTYLLYNHTISFNDIITFEDPLIYLSSCSLQQLKELSSDISMELNYCSTSIQNVQNEDIEIDKDKTKKEERYEYWKCCYDICEYLIEKLTIVPKSPSQSSSSSSFLSNLSSGGWHRSVNKDIEELLSSKTENELNELLIKCQEILNNPPPSTLVDLPYWEHLYQHLQLFLSQNTIKYYHKVNQIEYEKYLEANPSIIDEDVEISPIKEEKMDKASILLRRYQHIGLGLHEDLFVDEIKVPNKDPNRTIKPLYYNIAKTGVEWTSYNRAHYDFDNPPPKSIEGYRFTLFYPDLLDPTDGPRYFREIYPDDEQYEILRFNAGLPYQDIAFKIYKREWDIHRKSDFINIFERGVLTLNLTFRQYLYRR